MKKLERLITLAKLRQGGERLTVREMSQACGVSQRTLYRYLNILSELDSLAELVSDSDSRRVKSGSTRLSADETNLLRYALDNNLLTRYPHLARRFRSLSLKLGLGRGRSIGGEVYQFRRGRSLPVAYEVDNFVNRFGKACVGHHPVKIRFRGRKGQVRIVWPRAILVKGDRVSLLAAPTERGRPQEFELDRIHKLDSYRGYSTPGLLSANRKNG